MPGLSLSSGIIKNTNRYRRENLTDENRKFYHRRYTKIKYVKIHNKEHSSNRNFDDGSNDLQNRERVTGEGSGTHEDEKGEIPSSGEGLGGSSVAVTKADAEPGNHKEEAGESQRSGERPRCPIVIVTKPDDRVLVSDDHGTVGEVVLCSVREPADSPAVADQTGEQGVGFLVADTSSGAISTTVENSGCPVQVQSQLVVGSDLNVSISEMVCGSIEPEGPRLLRDAPLPSGKGEEDVNPEAITPLALWNPNGVLDLVSVEVDSDGFSEDEVLEPSEWVRRKIRGFSTFVGFPIDVCERQCIDFFQKLERVWEQQATAVTTRRLISDNLLIFMSWSLTIKSLGIIQYSRLKSSRVGHLATSSPIVSTEQPKIFTWLKDNL
ncbi:hypothetical protein SO802_014781 [Lithocarpus litseifolius]|uniref:Uncharacterized protein n=1 Tax=Lithocarpus litseifolius TaxID=425828 RepID=A0AAW2CW04_9ROSI